MEIQTRTFFDRLSLVVGPLFFVTFTFLVTGSDALADGKLRRVKQAVRKNNDRPVSLPNSNHGGQNEPKEDSSRDDSRHDNHHASGDNNRSHDGSHRNHGARSSGFAFFSQPQNYVQPIIFPVSANPSCVAQEQVFCENVSPVQPWFPQGATGALVVQPSDYSVAYPVPQTIDESSEEPVSNGLFEPVEHVSAVPGISVGSDWFANNSSRFWALVGSDFDGITTAGLGLHLQSFGGLGLDSSIMSLRESTEYYRDHLWIGDVNVVYEVLARRDVRGRVGLGVNWLSDSWGAEAGLNLTAGVDLRLTDRMTLSAEGDIGNLGDADFFHGRVNLARRFESCEWMLGFDHYKIGGAEVNACFTGIQFRF